VKTDLGGETNKLEMNGDKTARIITETKSWKLSGLKVSIEEERDDMEFLQGIAKKKKFGDCTATYADETTRGGKGTIVDDIVKDEKTSTAEITLAGPGSFEK
jgi:hypothetical protein